MSRGRTGVDLAAPDEQGREPAEQELRLALVMNGGVSLAVWIGGACREFHRLAQGDGVYGDLLALTHSRARIDVLSGTSAGGINGAFLALALAHRTDLTGLRDLWVRRGAFQQLLRSPFEKDPPSLLRGDEYLLEELRAAFRGLWRDDPDGRASPEDVPLDLTLTTTLLHGQSTNLFDDFGTLILDVDHRARFRFRRERGQDEDPFADEAVLDRLALASRCTSSFPGAFEASYCPVGGTTEKPARPDMAGYADFEGGAHKGAFVIDGGVLDNKPLGPALRSMFGQPSDGDVRRVLAYVVPDPGAVPAEPGDDPQDVPSAGSVVLSSLVNLPRVESVRADIEQLRRHNARVFREREGRVSITNSLSAEKLYELSSTLLGAYQERRTSGAVGYLVDRFAGDVSREVGRELGQRGLETVRRLLEEQFRVDRLPWIPSCPPAEDSARQERKPSGWAWGLHALEHLSLVLFDTLRRTQRLAYRAGHEASRMLARSWRQTYTSYERLEELRRAESRFWGSEARENADRFLSAGLGGADDESSDRLARWASDVLGRWRRELVDLSEPLHPGASRLKTPVGEVPKTVAFGWIARQMALILQDVVTVALPLAEEAEGSPNALEREQARRLRGLARFFTAEDDAAEPADETIDEIVRRMLVLEVVQTMVGGRGQRTEQVVELIQVSGNAPNAFDPRREVGEKLAGVQLGHFGAFYKRSWRASDWMFGRLDAVERLAHVLLNPDRLRQVYGAGCFRAARAAPDGESRVDRVVERLRDLAVEVEGDEEATALLAEHWDDRGIRRELGYLEDATADTPEFLPRCVRAVTRRLQLEVVREELTSVASAIEEDLEQGGDRTGPGAAFLRRVRQAMRADRVGSSPAAAPALGARAAVDLFRACHVGAERVEGELGTDLFATTASHTAAVTATLGTGARSGLGVFRHLLRAVSAPAILLHLSVQNAARGSRVGPVVNAAALAAGLTIVCLDLLIEGTKFPPAVSGLGFALVVAGVAFLLLMSHMFFPVVLAVVAVLATLFGTGVLAGGLESRLGSVDLSEETGYVRMLALAFGLSLIAALLLWGAEQARLHFVRRRRV
jgi:patatin-related protein